MKAQYRLLCCVGVLALGGLCLMPTVAGAQNIAWDMVSSSSQNLISFSTDAPAFSSPGDGFQKYQVGVSESIPYGLVDDTNNGYPADTVGVIDASTDHDEFFGVIDTVNGDNPGPDPYHATWVFDISSGTGDLTLSIDLGAMGDFEADDSFVWSFQVDGAAPQTFLTAAADEDGTLTYTMADGTTRDLDDPLVVDGVTLSNVFQSFQTPVPSGSTLTVVLTALTDGGSEGFVARDIVVVDSGLPGQGGGAPIPATSPLGRAALVLLLMAAGLLIVRRNF